MRDVCYDPFQTSDSTSCSARRKPDASGGVKIVKIGRFENRCRRERTGRKRDEEFSGLDAVFHTEACAFDKDDFGMVEKAVEDGGGNGAVAVED